MAVRLGAAQRVVGITAVVALMTTVLLAGAVLTSRLVLGATDLGVSRTVESCDVGVTTSPPNGPCVDRVHRPDLVAVPGRREVQVRAVVDGATSPRYLAVDDPFDGEVSVEWLPDGGVRVTGGAVHLEFDAAAVRSLRTD